MDECPHDGTLHRERMFGYLTGDRVCADCGETFAPGEAPEAKSVRDDQKS